MKIGFPGLLTILFIALKLLNIITWSWLWILSPLWIAFALIFGVYISVILVTVIMEDRARARRKRKF